MTFERWLPPDRYLLPVRDVPVSCIMGGSSRLFPVALNRRLLTEVRQISGQGSWIR